MSILISIYFTAEKTSRFLFFELEAEPGPVVGIPLFPVLSYFIFCFFLDTHECIKVLFKNLLLVLVREGLELLDRRAKPLRMERGASSVSWNPHTE